MSKSTPKPEKSQQVQSSATRFEFRTVRPYICPTCRHFVTVRPCPGCLARQVAPSGLTAVDLAATAARRNEQQAAAVQRMAEHG